MTRRILISIAVLLTLLCSVALADNATIVDSGDCGDNGANVTWTFDSEGTLTVSGEGRMMDYDYLDSPLYEKRDSIKSAVISDGVTSIGNFVFCGCEYLTGIVIPEGVTSIGDHAFYSCKSLTSIVIPEGVTSIGESAFSYCTSLTSIILSGNVSEIADHAFDGCSSDLIFFAPADSHAANWAEQHGFQTAVSKFTENGVVYTILNGKATVTNCTEDHPKDMALPESVAGVPLTAIGSEALAYCQNLRRLYIPEGVTTIDMLALSYSSLEIIFMPRSVTFIDESAFEACNDSLVFVAPSDSYAAQWAGEMGYMCFESKPRDIAGYNLRYFLANDEITVVRCSEAATSVDIPAEVLGYPVTAIARGAFSGRTNLTELVIPDSISSIGNEAFWGCDGLTDVRIPESVTHIGSYVFGCCSNLASIDLPVRLNNIGKGVFYNCPSLKKVDLPEGINCIPSETFDFCTNLTEVTIPDGVTSIGDYAFEECWSLTDVTFPDSLTTLGESAFYCCTSLTKITLPDGATTIGMGAFGRCTSLTDIALPASVTSIDDYAFEGCNEELIFYAPAGSYAASWATDNGYAVEYPDGHVHTEVTTPAVPATHVTEGRTEGSHCSVCGETLVAQEIIPVVEVVKLTLPGALVRIEEEAFANDSIACVVLPDGCTRIGAGAFRNCTELRFVEIPASVTSIDSTAFEGCGDDLIIVTVPDSEAQRFAQANSITCVLLE